MDLIELDLPPAQECFVEVEFPRPWDGSDHFGTRFNWVGRVYIGKVFIGDILDNPETIEFVEPPL